MVSDQLKRDIEEALTRATMLQQHDGGDPPVLLIVPRSQASDLLAIPGPNENGVVDIGGADTVPVVIFDALEIRDGNNHRPAEVTSVLDLRAARYWSFEIQNDHDEALTIELIGGSNRTPDGMGLLGVTLVIAANTIEPIATDIWLPFMSMQASYVTSSPTSGSLTARGFRQVFSR